MSEKQHNDRLIINSVFREQSLLKRIAARRMASSMEIQLAGVSNQIE
ncbi:MULTISPECIES: hypothetical protein [Pantoea]|nr:MULTISPECIES: hypothetical protein [Pantoea]